MKKFEFDHSYKAWDRFNQFHNTNYPFIEFEHGQLIVAQLPDPNERRYYDRYGVTVTTTTDPNLPPIFRGAEDEKPMPKAWLQQGGQQFITIDWEQGVVVGMGHAYYMRDHSVAYAMAVPDNLRTAAMVYWSGPARLPVSNSMLKVSSPDPKTMAELTPKLADVRPALHAIKRMKTDKNESYWRWRHHGKVEVRTEWLNMTTEELVAELSKDDLTLNSVVKHGFASKRMVEEVPYLYVKKEK